MDKESALLIASKDLFIEAWKTVPEIHKHPNQPKGAPGYQFLELDLFADRFLAFHERLKSKLHTS